MTSIKAEFSPVSRQSTANFLHGRQPHLLTYCKETEPARRTQDKEAKEYRSIDYSVQFLQHHKQQQQRGQPIWRELDSGSAVKPCCLRRSLEQRWLSSANDLPQACRSGGSFLLLLSLACSSLLPTNLELMKQNFQCILSILLFNIFDKIKIFFSSLLKS